MTPRPDVSEVRKSQILEAAIKVFSKYGFAEARMDDIVAESGLSKGALYWYFESKDEIILSILDQIFDTERAYLEELLDSEDSSANKLRLFVEASIQDLENMQPLMPIFFDFWSLSVRKQNINQAIQRYYQNLLDLLVPIIQQGIERGEFQVVNSYETAVAMGALFEGTILFYLYFQDNIDIENQFRSNFNLILEGLLYK